MAHAIGLLMWASLLCAPLIIRTKKEKTDAQPDS